MLGSSIMTSLERILLHYLVSTTEDKFNPCQFAYKNVVQRMRLLHWFKHLDKSNENYARALFLDYSLAFDTTQSDILVSKMVQLELNPYLIHWYASFLTNRTQMVKVNRSLASAITSNVGTAQGCVSSAVLFTFYTDDSRTEKCLSDCCTNTPGRYSRKRVM